jgi:hypothetical protein
MHTDRYGSISGQENHTKESRREYKIQEFVHRGTTNVKYEM